MWNPALLVFLVYVIAECFVKRISLNIHVWGVIPPILKIQMPLVFSVCSECDSPGENRWSFVFPPCIFFFHLSVFNPLWLIQLRQKALSLLLSVWTGFSVHIQSIWKGRQWERFGWNAPMNLNSITLSYVYSVCIFVIMYPRLPLLVTDAQLRAAR